MNCYSRWSLGVPVVAAGWLLAAGCAAPKSQEAAKPAAQPVEASRSAVKSPEQQEQERKQNEAADRTLAAESAVRSMLTGLGEVKSVSFEDFRDSDDDYQGRGIKSRFAAEVVASEDLVTSVNQIGWEESPGNYVNIPVLQVAAPKGTRLLVVGQVNGKSVAGRHVFQAQQQEVHPAPGVVLPTNRDAYNAQYALAQARLRSTFKDGVLDGSPEHLKAQADARQKEQTRRDAERQRQEELRDREVTEVFSVLAKTAAGDRHMVMGTEGGGRAEWMFGRSLSGITVDPAKGEGRATITNWLEFPPTATQATFRKFKAADGRFGDDREQLCILIETDEPGEAYALDRADGGRLYGRRVGSVSNMRNYGDPVVLTIAEPAARDSMTKWKAKASESPAFKLRSARMLDKAELQDVMKSTPFVDGDFTVARCSDRDRRRVEEYRDSRRAGFELYENSTLIARSAAGVSARTLLFQLTQGSLKQPVIVVNGKSVPVPGSGVSEGGVILELEAPTQVYEVRLSAAGTNGNMFAVQIKCNPGEAGSPQP